ncbi:MAG: polysaccharide deacetylase family protein [Planctomycetota bacterium]|jgi:hypothetical protein
MYLLITIDTEGDNAWASKGYENYTKNARFLPRFQHLCDDFGFKPTYLTSYEMAKDDFFIEFVADTLRREACEVGLHPHAWNSPPEYKLTSDDMGLMPYMIEYPEHIIREKVKIHTELLEERLGLKMYSHRAGRWAFNAKYAQVLCEFGYKVDCSITPYVKGILPNRSDSEPVKVELPDYSQFPAEPYFLDEEDISLAGGLPLLEVPMTVIPHYRHVRSFFYELLPHGMCRRMYHLLFGTPVRWFRPSRRRPRDLMRVAKSKIKDNSDYIMFMIHSSELMPGANPQFRNVKETDQLYENIYKTFQWLYQKGVTGTTCWEFYNAFVGAER